MLIKPGGFFRQKLIYTGFMPNTCVTLLHVPFLHHYMHRYDLNLAKLGCLAPVLTPTFLIVRLGGKGSTSAIVTIGSSEPDLRLGEAESQHSYCFQQWSTHNGTHEYKKIYCTSLIITMSTEDRYRWGYYFLRRCFLHFAVI